MEKIADIIESIANEKGLEIEDVKERVIRAIINTAKKIYGENYEYDAVIDNATKTLHLYQKITVVGDGDIEEALNAASAIGDDALQKKYQGRVTPDSFTHGSSKQRIISA